MRWVNHYSILLVRSGIQTGVCFLAALQFIDATKRGGIGRFANHSCDPNSYVAKWTIGQHIRMGIFSSRAIKKDEELTFNYNVDRYG
jgi:SET domain-containing protein